MTDNELNAVRTRSEKAAMAIAFLSAHDPRYFTGVEIRYSAEDVPPLLAEVDRLRAGLQAVIAAYDAEPPFAAEPDYWSGLQRAGMIAADVLGVTV